MTSALNRQTEASALSRAITIGGPVGLEADRRAVGRPPAGRCRATAGSELKLDVGRVGRRGDVGRAVRVEVVDVMRHAEQGTGGRPLLKAGLEGGGVLVEDEREPGPGEEGAGRDRVVERGDAVAPEHAGGEVGVEDRERLAIWVSWIAGS